MAALPEQTRRAALDVRATPELMVAAGREGRHLDALFELVRGSSLQALPLTSGQPGR